jgi:hypothetical protein
MKTPAAMMDADKLCSDLHAVQHALLQARTAMEFSGATFASPSMASINRALDILGNHIGKWTPAVAGTSETASARTAHPAQHRQHLLKDGV